MKTRLKLFAIILAISLPIVGVLIINPDINSNPETCPHYFKEWQGAGNGLIFRECSYCRIVETKELNQH